MDSASHNNITHMNISLDADEDKSSSQENEVSNHDAGYQNEASNHDIGYQDEASNHDTGYQDKSTGNDIGYPCNSCDFKTNTKDNLRAHVKRKHEDIIYPCTHCDFKTNGKDNLKRHIHNKHEGLFIFCDLCDYKTTRKSFLTTHVQSKHEHIYHFCNQCDYSANLKSNLKKHIQSKHEGIRYFCELCDYAANQKGQLKTHVNSKHKGIYFYCNKCDYKSGHQSTLKLHIESKHENKSYTCIFCGCKVSRKSILKRHIELKHSFKIKNDNEVPSTEVNIQPKAEQYSDLSPEKCLQINLVVEENRDIHDKDSKDNLADIVIKEEILDSPLEATELKDYYEEQKKEKSNVTYSEERGSLDNSKGEGNLVSGMFDQVTKGELTGIVVKEEILDNPLNLINSEEYCVDDPNYRKLKTDNVNTPCTEDGVNFINDRGEEDIDWDIPVQITTDNLADIVNKGRKENVDLDFDNKAAADNHTEDGHGFEDSEGEEYAHKCIPDKTTEDSVIKEENVPMLTN